MAKKKEMTKLARKFEKKISNVETFGANSEEQIQQVIASLDMANMSNLFGRVDGVGRTFTGSFWVAFHADSGGVYSGTWPEWAFNLANSALLNGKKLRVVASLPPSGDSFLWVMVSSDSV